MGTPRSGSGSFGLKFEIRGFFTILRCFWDASEICQSLRLCTASWAATKGWKSGSVSQCITVYDVTSERSERRPLPCQHARHARDARYKAGERYMIYIWYIYIHDIYIYMIYIYNIYIWYIYIYIYIYVFFMVFRSLKWHMSNRRTEDG